MGSSESSTRSGRIFPGVSVAGVDVSGLSPSEASVKLSQTLSYPYSGKIVLRDGGGVWVVTPAQMGMTFDPSSSAQAAYQLGRRGGIFNSLDGQLRARSNGADIPPVIVFDQRGNPHGHQNELKCRCVYDRPTMRDIDHVVIIICKDTP